MPALVLPQTSTLHMGDSLVASGPCCSTSVGSRTRVDVQPFHTIVKKWVSCPHGRDLPVDRRPFDEPNVLAALGKWRFVNHATSGMLNFRISLLVCCYTVARASTSICPEFIS